jgi:hypothetical protein
VAAPKPDATIDLPGKVVDAVVGGSGRYIVLPLPAEKKMAIFDAKDRKLAKVLPVAESEFRVAAGSTHFVVLLPNSKVVQRYSFQKLEREAIAPLDVTGKIQAVVMGSASSGPLVVQAEDGLYVMDPMKLKSEKTTSEHRGMGGPGGGGPYVPEIRISANGKILTSWQTRLSPNGISVHTIEGTAIKTTYAHQSAGALYPSADGSIIVTNNQLFEASTKPIGNRDRGKPGGGVWYAPSVQGTYYLVMNEVPGSNRNQNGRLTVDIRMFGQETVIATLPGVAGVNELIDWIGGRPEPMDRHVFFLPDFKVLAVIPKTGDKLFLTNVDVSAALEKSGGDYLLVTSKPPTDFTVGQKLSYAIAVKVKKGPAKCKLESGPEGMTVTADGKLEWAVPAGFAEKEVSVIVSVTDAGGQETFHSFKLAKK